MARHPVLSLALCGLLLLLSGCDTATDSAGVSSGALSLVTTSGESFRWSELRGDWVLVNYWAEWCKPCLEEIPELNHLDRRDGVKVLAVNYDGVEGQALVELGQRMGIEYRQLTEDPASALGWQGPAGLPATFLVKPSGELADTLLGAQTEAGLLDRIGRD